MYTLVEAGKYVNETISIIISFADVIPAGDSIIGIPTVTVTVASGIDVNPGNLLYEGVSVIGGTAVEQRIRLGLPGVIYNLLYTIGTAQGNLLEKECYLAILPQDGLVIPNWVPLWEGTQLYPVEHPTESLQATSVLSSGTLLIIVVNYYYGPEELQGAATLTYGNLHIVVVPYNYSYEALQGTSSLAMGTLIIVVIPYNYSYEALKGNSSLLSGALTVVVIPYSYSYEALQATATFQNGALI